VGSAANNTAVTTASVTRAAGGTTNLYTVCCGTADGAATLSASNTTTAFTWTSIFPAIKNGASQLQCFWAVPSTTASQTITCTKTGANAFTNIMLDEWAGTETTTPIDVSSATFNTVTNCATTNTMTVNNEAMVSASQDSITLQGNINSSAATKGADDGAQDWTEYRILSGSGAGSTITATFSGTASGSECVTFGIQPPIVAGAASSINQRSKLERYYE
jgi:hypothetical protein